jgi:DDE family transposase
MSRHPQLYPWAQEISTRLPAVNPALANVLALWSVGMVLTKRSGLDSVTQQLTNLLGQSFDTLRQRLREFYQEASAKRGRNRTDFEVTECFASLLGWVLSFWSEKRLALALDVTNLGERYHVLCISALCGGVGIPVAWKILEGNEPDAWHPYWCELLAHLKGAVEDDWQVVVLSDRGLESARLFRAIVDLGWHPLMRVKAGGKFRPKGWHRWYWLRDLAPRLGERRAFVGQAYKGAPLECTLLACWEEAHEEPWLLLTDLPPGTLDPCLYAWRAWIEQGFKVAKSGGLNWQNTRMTYTNRAERQFLAIAVTTLWLVAVGAEVERQEQIETLSRLPGQRSKQEVPTPRRMRLFVQGLTAVMGALLRGVALPRGRLFQERWPEAGHMPTLSENKLLTYG